MSSYHGRKPLHLTHRDEGRAGRPHRKNRKKKQKNSFDMLVLVLVLATLAIPIGHLIRIKTAPIPEEVTLTLRLSALLPEIAQAAANTDSVSIDGLFPLTVVHTERRGAKLTLQAQNGAFVDYRSSKREDIIITLQGRGIFSADGFLLDGRRPLSPGMTLTLSATDLTLSALLLRVERAAQNPSIS